MRVRLAELQNENTVKTVVMWTWASVSQTFTSHIFCKMVEAVLIRQLYFVDSCKAPSFSVIRLINSRIAVVIQTTLTIVTSLVSDTQYLDVQRSMKHLRKAKITGLIWKKKTYNMHNMFTLLPAYGQWNAHEPTKAVIVVFFSFLRGMVFLSEV